MGKSCHPLITILLGLPMAVAAADETIDFNRDIKPILSGSCFKCHGSDEHDRKADLRLDTREGAVADLGGYVAVEPGNADASELIARIITDDSDDLMPPSKSGPALKPEEVERLKRWIASGAEYAKHWSFEKPARPARPKIEHSTRNTKNRIVRSEIDAFVQARLEKENLKPRPESDPHILLRRLYIDLVGYPPQPDEVAAFLKAREADPDAAYEHTVDTLLNRKAYGERWAAPWLDLARYADSKGYASDNLRTIWAYRDWVINALNDNVPYDRFTLEQLAGDLLPNATPEQRIATAFHRNTMNNTEGGTDNEEFRVAAVKDRVNTTMQVWMGLTMRCAECHSHKYDPITHEEYYRFYDFFNQSADVDTNDDAPTMPVPDSPEGARRAELQQQIDALSAELKKADPAQLLEEQRKWEGQYRGDTKWHTLTTNETQSLKGAKLSPEKDGSVFVSGKSSKNDTYTLEVESTVKTVTGFRLETIPDERNPGGGAGRSPEGRFFLNRFAANLDTGGKPFEGRFVRVELPGKDKFLHLAEVEVFSGDTNIARNGKATQTSTDFDGSPENAINGNTDGDYKKAKTSHTASATNPWWEVDLGKLSPVDRIVLWNRTDGGTAARIEGYGIKLLDENRQVVWEESKLKAPKKEAEFALSGNRQLIFTRATADFATAKFPVSQAIGKVSRNLAGWDVTPKQTERHEAVFVLGSPVELADGDKLTVTLDHHYNYGGQLTLGRFRLSATNDPALLKRGELPPDILRLVDTVEPDRSVPEVKKLADYFRGIAPSLAKIRNEIAALQKKRNAIKPPTVPVMVELVAGKRRETKINNRGNFMDLGDKVESGVPASFHPFPKDVPQNRIGVAKWLTDPENPLTARVAVNRIWAQLFGLGLVETEEDFGAQGTYPSHPKLLDWLATEYQRIGWDRKALIKTIVMSATYRQSSSAPPELFDRDPDNKLLARGPRFRLDAEQVRDQALTLSGLRTDKIGGPPVYPPQPPGMWRAAFNGADRKWKTSEGEDRYRRGLYTFWRRSVPYPSMATFDAPSREVCNVRRIRTNTPLQAFVTLNDPVFVEIAQAMAKRILTEGGETETDRVHFALRLALVRPPTPDEVKTVTELYQDELAVFEKDAAAAKELAVGEKGEARKDINISELAAWTSVSNILLNLDAVLTKS